MVDWVENGTAPDSMTVKRLTDGVVDNERIVCPYPQQASYAGEGDPNDPGELGCGQFHVRVSPLCG